MMIDRALYLRLGRYLPADILDKLADANVLTDVLRRLNAVENVVRAFVPLYVSQDERMLTQIGGQMRPGTFLFADVSGFTALSERLQAISGSNGAEILTTVINDYFAAMLDILSKSDGQLLKFAGDALLAFFPEANEDDAVKAVRTGLRMQRAMSRFQPIENKDLVELLGQDHAYALKMSIGISRGKLFEAIIGNHVQRDHFVQGELPSRAMRAEALGEHDDVIIDTPTRAALGDVFQVSPLDDGFYEMLDTLGDQLDDYEFRLVSRRRGNPTALFDFDTDSLLASLTEQVDRVEKVAPFVPPAVLHELLSSGDELKLQSQNRLVVTMFIHVSGFAQLLDAWGDSHLPLVVSMMDRYYSLLHHVISTRGGSITRSDPYQLGVKLLITFGAPIAHTDDPQRAVDAALELRRQLALFNERIREELPAELRRDQLIEQRAGITLGSVFAGEVGWRSRREYTVMGDDVNLSARLMAHAAMGQILLSSRVWERVNTLFDTEPTEPLHLRGKSKTVQAFAVKGYSRQGVSLPSVSETPFVGQEYLLQTMSKSLLIARRIQQKQVVALLGDAGLGKTRIAKEMYQLAAAQGFQCAWTTCALKSERKTTWSSLVAQLMQIDPSVPAHRQQFHARLAELGIGHLESVLTDLVFDTSTPLEKHTESTWRAQSGETPRSPIDTQDLFQIQQRLDEPQRQSKTGLFDLAARRVQANEQTQDSTASTNAIWGQLERRTSLTEAVVELLKAYTRDRATFIVIDDFHRENPQAQPILERLLGERGFMSLVVLVTSETAADLDPRIQQLPVSDLSEQETYLMALGVLHVDEIGERLRQVLWSRTNGRPIFIEGLLNVLMDSGAIEHSSDVAELHPNADVDALPDDARKLIVSRVDRLRPEAQGVLRAAAVLAESFTEEALMYVSDITNQTDLSAALHDLTRAELIEVGANRLYHFRHGMTQRAVYEMMPRLVRQKLHSAAADYLTQQPNWQQQPLTVAHHWLRGGKPTRAIELVTMMAEETERRGDFEQAVELYTYAQQINPSDKSLQLALDRLQGEQTT